MRKFKLFGELGSIGQLHGRVFDADASYGKIKIVPLYHPAAAIYNNNLKETLKKDFEVLNKFK